MSSILLTVAYDGTSFAGWAPQRNARTVAGELLGAVQAMDPAVTQVRGASRTDAGVHARGQLVTFESARQIEPKGWALGLSAHLSDEIAVRRAANIEPGADLRGSVVRKRYRYLIVREALRDPFWRDRALRFSHSLDLDAMRDEAATIVGTHDFAAYRTSADERTNTIRTIVSIRLEALAGDARVLAIDVVGTAFLHNMVRIIVGSLLDVGRGRLARGALTRALDSKMRGDLGMTAPAQGLYLEHIEHTLALANAWPPAALEIAPGGGAT